MGRKRNPYLPLYTRDIMSSPRCRALSCQASGVYLWLLCRLNEPPTPGAFRLSDWEAHPTWRRSLTQQCLAEPDKQRRLLFFARYLAKNDLPWDRKDVLDGLQELYKYGIIVIEGDMLVQPRMYKDNGFELPDLDNDGDPEDTILDDAASGSMAVKTDEDLSDNKGAEKRTEKGTRKGTEKVQRKAPVSHARASRAEIEIENNINNKGTNNKIDSKRAKNEKFVPPTLDEVQRYCEEKAYTFDPIMFYNHYEANGWVQGKGKPIKSWRAQLATWQQREAEFTTPVHKTPPAGSKTRPGDAVPVTDKGAKDEKW
jgi:hypothetical protein